MASNLNDSENKAIEFTDYDSEEDSDTEAGMDDVTSQFCKVLQSILETDRSKLPLPYSYSSLLPSAGPNCLSIEGLGTSMKLPLSETDAKRTVAFASRARFAQTIVNKEVQNAWEINAARVKFENPKWYGYVQDLAVETVCSELGLTKYDTPPRCELSKLLVYETGSRVLPQRDDQKTDGTFATMIILLPSRFTGGEFRLSHASESEQQVIDYSSATTAVVAWYTDVLHEMTPITSGYRLALSYNIIHTSRDMPLPTVLNADHQGAKLRRVLCNWNQRCKERDTPDCIAYLLKHQCSEADFGRRASLLKGEDSQRIAFVRTAAEGLDFVILLAKFKYQITDNDFGYSGCCPCIIVDKSVTLSNWVDLDSEHVLLGDIKSIGIKRCCFLPKNALRGVRSDGEEVWERGSDDDQDDEKYDDPKYDGVGSSKAFWYYRSVFVLVPSDKLPQILIRNGAMEVVFKQFKESLSENAPTEKDTFLANLIISNLKRPYSDIDSTLPTILDCDYKWKDVEMWQDLMEHFEKKVGVQSENGLVRAFRVFEFNQIRQTVEKLLRAKRQPTLRLAFIDAIRQAASESNQKDVIQEWCSAQVKPAVGRPAGNAVAGKKRKRT